MHRRSPNANHKGLLVQLEKRIRLDKGHRNLEDLVNGLVRGRAQYKPVKNWEKDWLV